MQPLRLIALSLRYSSWSIRPWLALSHANADFETEVVELPDLGLQGKSDGPGLVDVKNEQLARRRGQGSVTGLFPILHVEGRPIHESLAICEWVADAYPRAELWPADAIDRAQARAVCCEMTTGFHHLRTEMSCHVFARVPGFLPDASTALEIERAKEIWRTSLAASGGPFLFGSFGIADCMFFPVLTRFRTYGIELEADLETYAERVESQPAVRAWRKVASIAPEIPVYDEQIRKLGGDPEAARSKA